MYATSPDTVVMFEDAGRIKLAEWVKVKASAKTSILILDVSLVGAARLVIVVVLVTEWVTPGIFTNKAVADATAAPVSVSALYPARCDMTSLIALFITLGAQFSCMLTDPTAVLSPAVVWYSLR